MIEKRQGNLVHVGSIASNEAVGSVGYNIAKAGLAAYVRSIGPELSPHNVIATGISPGGFIAPENAMARLKERNSAAYEAFIEERLPRGVMGTAEEIVPLLVFLCSSHAVMMGGCMVPIDAAEGKAY
jgi:3-oxoacyl-[acyl-carrier protein] reductase